MILSQIIGDEYQQRIRIAFDIILEDFKDRLETSTARVQEFSLADTLRITTSSYLQDEDRISSLSFLSTNLAKTAYELKRFGQVNLAQRVLLYGANKRLLSAYDRKDGQEATGIYVELQEGEDAYLPVDDPSQLTPMLLGRTAIPDTSLPYRVAAYYDGEIPKTVSAELFSDDRKLGIRITAPISHEDTITGFFIVDMYYTQSIVEQYAELSKAEINFFINENFSIGTLPEQANFIPPSEGQVPLCEAILGAEKEIFVVPTTFGNQEFYQGQCVLQNAQETVGTITVSLSKDIEKQIIGKILIAVLTVSGIAIIITTGLSLLFSRKAIHSIRNIMTVIGAMAEGDLQKTVTVIPQDEFGMLAENLNRTIEQLRAIVTQVQKSGIQVTSSSTELAATAKQQEVTMKNQVESTNNVGEAIKGISNVATKLVHSVREVASMSEQTAVFASSGQTDLTRMEEAMQGMEKASKSISNRLEAIHEKADNITNVVTTITKVADQTNLLSLNAAIEAEKAGEYGRGFTVVAREIRRLADQTAVATLDIEQMVQEMQAAVSAGVMEMDKFITEVRGSAEDVEKISNQLTRIIEQVQVLSPRFEEVSVAMGNQSEHAQNIDNAMKNLGEEMQQTRTSLHETFSAIEQLNEASRGLQEQVSQFKVH